MSLVVLSNTQFSTSENVDVRPTGLDRAFSFTNTLSQPLIIPKNSEVALQSVKMNKDGLFSVGRFNSTMYQFIGTKLTDTVDAYKESTRHPALMRVREGGQLNGEYNVDDYVSRVLIPSMNRGIYHPDLQGLANASVQRTDSLTTFAGFNLTYDKAPSASGIDNRPTQNSSYNASFDARKDFVPGTFNSKGWEYKGSNHRFVKISGSDTAPGTKRAFAQIKSAPLSCCQGNMQVNYKNASEWAVGLSRYCNPLAEHTDPNGGKVVNDFSAPPYWKKNGMGFYDYVARAVKTPAGEFELRLYQSVVNEFFLPGHQLAMREVEYWTGKGAPITGGAYNLTTNGSGFDHIKFTVDGEAVDVTMTKGVNSVVTKICSPDYFTADGSDKNAYFKPVCQTNSYLYGKFEIGDAGRLDEGKDHYLQLHEYNARVLTGFNYDGIDRTLSDSLQLNQRLINFDWYATLINLRRSNYLSNVDGRPFNDTTNSGNVHKFVKTKGGKIFYSNVIILSQSDKYKPTLGANMENILGFTGQSVVDTPTSTNGSAVTFKSSTTPKLISNESVFIRLNSLTQRSTNGATGNQSKIIYHCPRFDNSGNETGGLFFEPGEKTYLDLHNSHDIQVSDFSIDIIDKRERYAKSVVGSTIVCLHIRSKK